MPRPAYLPERDWSFRSRLSMADHRSAWLTHHNLRAIGEGFPWPDLTMIPMKETTIVAWQRDRNFLPGWKVRFLSTGRAEVDRQALEECLVAFVDAVLTRLDEQHVRETPLAEEWRALQGLDPDEVEFCTAAARLGLDPLAAPPDVADLILQSAAQLSPSLLDDFLDAATPGRLRDEADWVNAHWRSIIESDRSTDPLPTLSNGERPLHGPAWEWGIRDARELRAALRVAPQESFDVGSWVAIERVRTVTRSLQGLGASTTTRGHLVALANPRSDEGERFTAARALWRFLRPGKSGNSSSPPSRARQNSRPKGHSLPNFLLRRSASLRCLNLTVMSPWMPRRFGRSVDISVSPTGWSSTNSSTS